MRGRGGKQGLPLKGLGATEPFRSTRLRHSRVSLRPSIGPCN